MARLLLAVTSPLVRPDLDHLHRHVTGDTRSTVEVSKRLASRERRQNPITTWGAPALLPTSTRPSR
jgi:hypothetical protein